MRIWIIQTGERLPVYEGLRKLRSAILAEKLAEKGHKVCWWANAFDHFSKEWVTTRDSVIELSNGITLNLLKGIGYKRNISIRRYIDHRIIAWKFRLKARKCDKPEVLVIATPSHDIAYQAVRFARSRSIPTIVDIRDPWPDIFIDSVPRSIRKLARLLLFNDFRMIKSIMRNANSLVAVSNTFLEWGLSYAGRRRTDKDLVYYLGYRELPAIENMKESPRMKHLIKEISNKFVVSYIGSFSSYGDPRILIDCAKLMLNHNIVFVLAGSGDHFDAVREKANGLPNVKMPGWLDQSEIDILLMNTHVGVCIAPKKIDLFPNKAFLYLAAGIPIISSYEGDLKELIEHEKIGYSYKPGDLGALAQHIYSLFCNETECRNMARRAKELFNRRFNEERIYYDYVNHIENMVLRQ
jgi:glycosyltransferase involved in cell wall biosynthesis